MNRRFCPGMTAWMLISLLVLVLVPIGMAWAQDAQEPVEVDAEEAVPEPLAKDATPPSPPPGPEVMRPTEHGLKMTPRMIELFAKSSAVQFEKELKLNEDQRNQLHEVTVKHMTDIQRRYSNKLVPAVEHLFELSIKTDGQIDGESARELSGKLKPALPAVTEFIDGFLPDARPILDDSQFKQLSEGMNKTREKIKVIEGRLDRWSRGEAVKGNLFRQLFDDDDEANKQELAKKNAGKSAKSDDLEKAEGRYDQALREIGPESWQMYLFRSKQVFGFTQEQYLKGDAILKDYRSEAKEVMTPEWVQKVRENRIKTHAKKVLDDDESIEPWLYHLNREYEEMVKPIKELGREYRREIMGLATEEQRAAVLAQLQKFGVEHGMSAADTNALASHLAATQPEGH